MNEKELIEKCLNLPENKKLEAYNILFGVPGKDRRHQHPVVDCDDFDAIVRGGTKSCVAFTRWMNLAAFLQKENIF